MSSTPAQALASEATLLMERGQFAESLAAFDRALALDPAAAAIWFARAEVKTFSPTDPDIPRMAALLADAETLADRIMLHFALGKAYMDGHKRDQAFAHLMDGNRLKRSTFTYDAQATDDWIAAIADSFAPALLERFAGQGDPSETPIFIVGMPRSGTTLIEQILDSHPQIHGAGELRIVQELVDDIFAGNYPHAVATLPPDEAAALGRRYLDRLPALAEGHRRIVDKMPTNFLHVGLIRLILPNARIIHCRRDAVDTCLSCYSKLFLGDQPFAYDLRELGLFYRSYDRLTAHWRDVLPADRFCEIRYESVVDDLEGSARRLVAFLGLDWDESCLRFSENRRPVHTASATQVRQPIYRTGVGRWTGYSRHLVPLLSALFGGSESRRAPSK